MNLIIVKLVGLKLIRMILFSTWGFSLMPTQITPWVFLWTLQFQKYVIVCYAFSNTAKMALVYKSIPFDNSYLFQSNADANPSMGFSIDSAIQNYVIVCNAFSNTAKMALVYN